MQGITVSSNELQSSNYESAVRIRYRLYKTDWCYTRSLTRRRVPEVDVLCRYDDDDDIVDKRLELTLGVRFCEHCD